MLSVSSSRAGGSVRPLAASDRSSDRSGFAGVGVPVGSRPVGGGAFFLVLSLFFFGLSRPSARLGQLNFRDLDVALLYL